ncbi:MAG: hypothetical protein RQ751_10500, partial [Longimicrobiales bacterium]|nr:hypothetical protein [Longimicrobiales bacterium]
QPTPRFLVLDAMDAPHNGRILRLRLQAGEAPSIRSLRGARLSGRGPRGETATVRVQGFPTFGGKPSDARLGRTGRVDVHVEVEGNPEVPVGLQWELTPAGD